MSAKTPENLAANLELFVESLTCKLAETTASSPFMCFLPQIYDKGLTVTLKLCY